MLECLQTPPKDVLDGKTFDLWRRGIQQLIDLLPFISPLHQSYGEMAEQGLLRDDYYLNYQVADIDFEAVILSSFINFDLGHYQHREQAPKMGLTIGEVKAFGQKYFDQKQKLCPLDHGEFQHSTQRFFISFGPGEKVQGMDRYLHQLLDDHLGGYDFSAMGDDEFSHVGGPILLRVQGMA